MSIEQTLRQLEVAGFCVLEEIIPTGEVEAVRASIEAAVAESGRDSLFEGVKSRKGLVSFDQSLVLPGSHRSGTNPTGDNGVDPLAPYPLPKCRSPVRYAPWCLNLDVLRPGSDERSRMVDETGMSDNEVEPLAAEVFAALPAAVKPLFRPWVSKEK